MAGLLDWFSSGSDGDLYGDVLSARQKAAVQTRGLLAMAGALADAGAASRLPVSTWGAIGKAAQAWGAGEDAGAKTALEAQLQGLKGQDLASQLKFRDLAAKALGEAPGGGGLPGAGAPGYAAAPAGSGMASGLPTGGGGGWGPHADPVIQTMRAAGASDAFIQGALANGLAEGGFATPWLKAGGGENSFGHWQYNQNGELPGYQAFAQGKGELTDSALQAQYLIKRMEELSPGITKSTDPRAVTDAIALKFERYKGAASGQRYGHLAEAQKQLGAAAPSGGATGAPIRTGLLAELPAVPDMAGRFAGAEGNPYAPTRPLGSTAPGVRTTEGSGGGAPPPDAPNAGGDEAPAARSGLLVPGGPFLARPQAVVPALAGPGPLALPVAPVAPAAAPAAPAAAPGGLLAPRPPVALPPVQPTPYAAQLAQWARAGGLAELGGLKNPFAPLIELYRGTPEYKAAVKSAEDAVTLRNLEPTERIKKEIELQYGPQIKGAEAEATKAVELRYAAAIADSTSRGNLPSQIVLKNVEAQNDLRNRMAPLGLQVTFDKDGNATTRQIEGASPAMAGIAGDQERAKEQAKADIAFATKPGIDAESKRREGFATQDVTARAQALAAHSGLQALDDTRQQLQGTGIFSGAAADLQTSVARFAAAAGWPSERLVNTQTYLQQAGVRAAEILRSGAFGTGSGVSANDLRAADRMAAGDNTVEIGAIKRILDLAEKKGYRDIDFFNSRLPAGDKDRVPHPPRLVGHTGDGKSVYQMPDGTRQVRE